MDREGGGGGRRRSAERALARRCPARAAVAAAVRKNERVRPRRGGAAQRTLVPVIHLSDMLSMILSCARAWTGEGGMGVTIRESRGFWD